MPCEHIGKGFFICSKPSMREVLERLSPEQKKLMDEWRRALQPDDDKEKP